MTVQNGVGTQRGQDEQQVRGDLRSLSPQPPAHTPFGFRRSATAVCSSVSTRPQGPWACAPQRVPPCPDKFWYAPELLGSSEDGLPSQQLAPPPTHPHRPGLQRGSLPHSTEVSKSGECGVHQRRRVRIFVLISTASPRGKREMHVSPIARDTVTNILYIS